MTTRPQVTTTTQAAIKEIGNEIIDLLLQKNRKYGDSATNPLRVFSKLSALEGLRVRMDDKLSRVAAGAADDDEDPVLDLAGYCILYLVAQRQEKESE